MAGSGIVRAGLTMACGGVLASGALLDAVACRVQRCWHAYGNGRAVGGLVTRRTPARCCKKPRVGAAVAHVARASAVRHYIVGIVHHHDGVPNAASFVEPDTVPQSAVPKCRGLTTVSWSSRLAACLAFVLLAFAGEGDGAAISSARVQRAGARTVLEAITRGVRAGRVPLVLERFLTHRTAAHAASVDSNGATAEVGGVRAALVHRQRGAHTM